VDANATRYSLLLLTRMAQWLESNLSTLHPATWIPKGPMMRDEMKGAVIYLSRLIPCAKDLVSRLPTSPQRPLVGPGIRKSGVLFLIGPRAALAEINCKLPRGNYLLPYYPLGVITANTSRNYHITSQILGTYLLDTIIVDHNHNDWSFSNCCIESPLPKDSI
jgi:hypothetical protein